MNDAMMTTTPEEIEHEDHLSHETLSAGCKYCYPPRWVEVSLSMYDGEDLSLNCPDCASTYVCLTIRMDGQEIGDDDKICGCGKPAYIKEL